MARTLVVALASLVLLAAPLVHARASQELPGHRVAPAEDLSAPAANGAAATQERQVVPPLAGEHSSLEIAFSIAVLTWGLVLIAVLTWVMIRSKQYWNSSYLRLCVLTVVVTAGLFVIVAGYTEQQIAPMMGLLGTLVGYLLGKGSDEQPAGQRAET